MRVTVLVRGQGSAKNLQQPLRQAISRADPLLPVTRLQTLDWFRHRALAQRRAGAALLAGFGLLGLVLATVGVAGAMAVGVSQRMHEIGVRLALGAAPRQVVRHFISRGMRLAALGLAIGLLLAVVASRLLSSMLFGVTAGDVIAYGAVTTALAVVALAACWIPARRAASVDPLKVLAAQ